MKPLSQSLTDLAARVKRPEDSAVAVQVARSWWSDTKGSIERQIAAPRADFAKRQAEHEQHNAEGAVVRAELARGEAEQSAVTS